MRNTQGVFFLYSSSQHSIGSEQGSQRDHPRHMPQTFCNLISERVIHHLYCILFFRSKPLNPVHTQGEGIIPYTGMNIRRLGSSGTRIERGLPQTLKYWKQQGGLYPVLWENHTKMIGIKFLKSMESAIWNTFCNRPAVLYA